MEQKHYLDITRLKEKYAKCFSKGEFIIIQEKLDGSNAAIGVDENGEIVAFSRRRQLTAENNLNGFFEFTQAQNKELLREYLGNRFIIFGEWMCLSGDTVIKKVSSGKARNTMTLREMYEQKYTLRKDIGCKRGINKLLNLLYKEKVEITEENYNKVYSLDKKTTIEEALNRGYIKHQNGKFTITQSGINYIMNYYFTNSTWGKDGFPSIYSLNLETDNIQTNKIMDIYYTGDKEVYEITTHKGYTIKATKEHKFLTPSGWKNLGELKELDCVAITDFISKNKHNRTYGKGTRLILKAQEEYKKKIGKCEECGSTVGLELHHIDENYKNNTEENWMILCKDCHKKIHTKKGAKVNNQPFYDYNFDYITSIKFKGIEDCYDISMSGGEELANFVANNFIVHNCKHTVRYPDKFYKNFYVFDIYDKENNQYVPWYMTLLFAKIFGFKTVPVFYMGEFTTWDDIYKYVGKTAVNAQPCGEGIVVKSQNRLTGMNDRCPSYVKIVSEKFSEVHNSHKKEIDPVKLAEKQAMEELAATIITERRITKLLEKFVENNIIPSDWDEKDMKIIAKNLPKAAYEDCLKEEPETVAQIEDFGKICGSLSMRIARSLIK